MLINEYKSSVCILNKNNCNLAPGALGQLNSDTVDITENTIMAYHLLIASYLRGWVPAEGRNL